MRIKVALLVDDLSLSRWQEEALSAVSDLLEVVVVLNCSNTVTHKRVFAHAGYYALNVLSIRSTLSRKRAVEFDGLEVLTFDSLYSGAWQTIPDGIVDAMRARGVRTIIKFGMSLLRMDNLEGVDVLSFHHGDPRFYRGRPAGFYEIQNNAPCVGMIVQKLSNVLDGGEVLALGHAKLYPYSYRQTIQGLYRASPALFRRALMNYRNGLTVAIKPKGKNYRLPGNWTVAKFCAPMLSRKFSRLLYGALFEKKWNIVVRDDLDIFSWATTTVSGGRQPRIPEKYSFLADPFFSSDGSVVRAEAMVASSGLGEIVEFEAVTLEFSRKLLAGPHFSYPYTVTDAGQEFILPEVAGHEAPYLLTPSGDRKIPLRGLEDARIVDPSLVRHGDHYYLFGGQPQSAAGMLYVYVADAPDGPYLPHPMNPVVMHPAGARMGGRLIHRDGALYRFGQDNSGSYGNGVKIMQVTVLSPDAYEEREIGELRFSDAKGPHTVDHRNGNVVLDYYVEKFSLLAGYRRLAAIVHSRLQKAG
ncbi:hypothetical protein FQY83_06950 [Luteimonas marina]|uniref:Glucosamine inositolphosphorylceramide transferase 1 N-terminal domain-containing protein n=1 Tax=Luteimonas marina TaxID=488485 RepID=A0A5C5U664_9GAMM|nr:hypothetical protein [Luteimonas marina]TWT21095.1 hypothetical protein FQY83_06950 [Luteimonas marina]